MQPRSRGTCRVGCVQARLPLHLQRVEQEANGPHVDEFTFRLNERNREIDTPQRLDALFHGLWGTTIILRELTA